MRQKDVHFTGHCIECRITAEDPDKNFAPASGTINTFDAPGGPGVRVDSHIYNGYTVPPFYDSLLAKILVHAHNRETAIARAQRALAETRIEGLATNLPFLRRILQNEYFQRGEVSTDFLARRMNA